MAEQAAIQTCIDLNLFQALADGGEKPVGLAELARVTGADAKLLGKSEGFWMQWSVCGEKGNRGADMV